MTKPYLDPDTELLTWGPVPGRLYYISAFADPFIQDYPKPYKSRWPKTLVLLREGKFVWLNELHELQQVGQRVLVDHILKEGWREQFNNEWQAMIEWLYAQMNIIEQTDFAKLSDDRLSKLARDFYQVCTDFESPTVPPEMANYSAEVYLKNALATYVPQEKVADTMSALIAPEEISFNQQEEIELAETNDIAKHQQKYFWLQNNFGGSRILPVDFFEKRKKELERNLRDKIKAQCEEVRTSKEHIRSEFDLSEKVLKIAQEVWQTVVMQDERKKHSYLAIHYLDVLLNEIARRVDYRADDLKMAWYFEVVDILQGKDMRRELKARQGGYGVQFDASGWRALTARETTKQWRVYVEGSSVGETYEITGVTACRGVGGVVKGQVRMLHDPSEVETIKEGEILVVAMTHPEYVFAMRKAAAIITDAGGLTSHAAIVSRELNKPCIIGTKIATQVLKDGDEVEVEADKGIVKVLRRA